MSELPRPDPDTLLARAAREEALSRRGRLKVFLGMAPGVGKTYAMLAAARRLAEDGRDVLLGLVETHGRIETEQQLLGLDVLPRRQVEYRGMTLHEFDLDAALARRPEIVVLDELAHTNAPGSRHAKRWEDVEALRAAGIDVLTTLNVQHIESLNDVVAKITGVLVKETIPDAVVDDAEEIELVDLPPAALVERLRAGKVYVPDSVGPALDSYFRIGNLTALREIALRRAAEWVDRRVRELRHGEGVGAVWPTADRIVVCVGPSPSSAALVRAAARMAAGLRAELLAVHVSRDAAVPSVLETLRLAERLGAEVVTLAPPPGAFDAAGEIVAYARARNATRIVLGATRRSRIATAILGSFMDDVIRRSGDIDVHVIRAEEPPGADGGSTPRRTPASRVEPRTWRDRWREAGAGLAIVTLAGAVAGVVFAPPDLTDEAMCFMAATVVAGWRFGRVAAIVSAVASAVAFNLLFTEPRFTLYVDDPSNVITLGVLLLVGLLVGGLTARTREQAAAARDRERRTASLYAITRELAAARGRADVGAVAVRHVEQLFDADSALLERRVAPHAALSSLPSAGPRAGLDAPLELLAAAGAVDWLDDRERGVALWALQHSQPAGLGTNVLPASRGRHLPLAATQGALGVLSFHPRGRDSLGAAELLMLETIGRQIAMSLERVALLESQQTARLDAETERLRSALLSSVSHDLRTPLAGIAGSASALLDGGDGLDSTTRRELLQGVVDESTRLADLVANLLFATRLESGGVAPRREWTTVEEVVGSGLAGLRKELADRPLRVLIPAEMPLLRVDAALMSQVVHNLVDNALRHTVAGTPIAVSAWTTDTSVILAVADEGSGLDDGELGEGGVATLFRRFHRGRRSMGMGLGLTICEGIVRAHGGRIWAEANRPSGALFQVALPIERPQPAIAPEEPA